MLYNEAQVSFYKDEVCNDPCFNAINHRGLDEMRAENHLSYHYQFIFHFISWSTEVDRPKISLQSSVAPLHGNL